LTNQAKLRILINIPLKHAKLSNQEIIVDMEYPGRDRQIKLFLEEMALKNNTRFDIVFQRIGKKSNAHRVAYQTNKKKMSADKVVVLKEIRQVLSL